MNILTEGKLYKHVVYNKQGNKEGFYLYLSEKAELWEASYLLEAEDVFFCITANIKNGLGVYKIMTTTGFIGYLHIIPMYSGKYVLANLGD